MARVRLILRDGRQHYECRWTDDLTGRLRTRTTGTSHRRDAERFAARLERDLESGEGEQFRATWADATVAYEREVFPGQARATSRSMRATWSIVEQVLAPKNLAALRGDHVARVVAVLRENGRSEWTVKSHVQRLGLFLRWCVARKMLARVPEYRIVSRPVPAPRGRAITSEEFDRLLDAVAGVVGDDRADGWRHLLRGLWWGGMRLGEAMILSWTDGPGKIYLDASRERPVLQIDAADQKNRRNMTLPVAPEFWEHVAGDQRRGWVFRPIDASGNRASTEWASKTISKIGTVAGIKTAEKRFCTAHDLRRSFGLRWAGRVRAATLMALMRHSSIQTTMQFYIGGDADILSEELWSATSERLNSGR